MEKVTEACSMRAIRAIRVSGCDPCVSLCFRPAVRPRVGRPIRTTAIETWALVTMIGQMEMTLGARQVGSQISQHTEITIGQWR